MVMYHLVPATDFCRQCLLLAFGAFLRLEQNMIFFLHEATCVMNDELMSDDDVAA
jgi:hypothetical protein